MVLISIVYCLGVFTLVMALALLTYIYLFINNYVSKTILQDQDRRLQDQYQDHKSTNPLD